MDGSGWQRRELLKLLGVGSVALASGLGCGNPTARPRAPARTARGRADDFVFLHLSDTHWGFSGPPNPEADVTLEHAVATIRRSRVRPDFVVFTGDLTHTTPDARERRARLARFRELAAGLGDVPLHFLPGEHDAAPDRGEAFGEAFGALHWSMSHKGVRFVAIDNASDPMGALGATQLEWLRAEVAATPATTPLVVFAHRPLFDLAPAWEWATPDGARAIEILSLHPNVTVFYGHIHHSHHHATGRITHHAVRSLVFPLPAPGSVEHKAPLPWDAAAADHGLGWRAVSEQDGEPTLTEIAQR